MFSQECVVTALMNRPLDGMEQKLRQLTKWNVIYCSTIKWNWTKSIRWIINMVSTYVTVSVTMTSFCWWGWVLCGYRGATNSLLVVRPVARGGFWGLKLPRKVCTKVVGSTLLLKCWACAAQECCCNTVYFRPAGASVLSSLMTMTVDLLDAT